MSPFISKNQLKISPSKNFWTHKNNINTGIQIIQRKVKLKRLKIRMVTLILFLREKAKQERHSKIYRIGMDHMHAHLLCPILVKRH